MNEILDITLILAAVCERLGMPYLVGGSLASSLHGIPRATEDVDLVVQMALRDVSGFVAALRGDFYLDEDAIRDAVERHTSFNLVHLGSYYKADVFVAKDDEPSRLEMERRQRFTLPGDPPRDLVVASAEDVVAQKLFWFALGDESSERQWRDAVGVLKVAGPVLDMAYLRRIAMMLRVDALLERALDEAELST